MTDATPGPEPDDPVATHWDDVLADMSAVADELRESGWDVLELHPGDVTPLTGEFGDRVGMDVLVPDDEFDDLTGRFDGTVFDEYDVYRTVAEGVAFAVCAIRSTGANAAVVYPMYYRLDEPPARRVLARARESGGLTCHFRRLDGETLAFRFEDADLFVPDGDAGAGPDPA